MNTAIIAAAGMGTRFQTGRPKQFLELLGKPVIVHTLERFQSCGVIDAIVLVLADEWRDEFSRCSERYDLSKVRAVVAGGNTRARSVRNGLDVIDSGSANIVAVHDGARPLVTVDEITRTVEKAGETGAACLAAEVTDTIKEIDGDNIVGTVDRQSLRRALTPQAFRYDLLCKAFDASDLNVSVTDECYLVERLGVKIALVAGSARNIKITRPEDLILAEAFLKNS